MTPCHRLCRRLAFASCAALARRRRRSARHAQPPSRIGPTASASARGRCRRRCARPGRRRRRAGSAVTLDRVVAVVNDEALTQYEMNEQKRILVQQLRESRLQPPAPDVLDKQVLERLITERALLQYAKETGIRVDDTTVERTILRIAQENKLSPDEFRKMLDREGIAVRASTSRTSAARS